MSPSKNSLEVPFPAPEQEGVDLLIIAGEHSGDEHGAQMAKNVLARNPDLKVAAIGGRHLEEAGAQLLFDLTQFSVVGFYEVLKNYSSFKKLFAETIDWIQKYRPKAVCFIDYPGFNLRLAQALFDQKLSKKAGGPVSLLYYIGPQVWAWKAKRRFKMAELIDSLAVIFPFEVETFADTKLETVFVGHPFLTSEYELPVQYDPDAPILLLPGSRSAALGRIAPVMLEALKESRHHRSKIRANCIYANDTLKDQLSDLLHEKGLKKDVDLVPNSETIGASAVLTSSGTMSLKCALAGIPGAVVYRLHSFTYALGRFLIKVPFIGIANLILGKALYPEYIQGAASPKVLATQIVECLEQPERIRNTQHLAAELRDELDKPSDGDVADWLLKRI